MHNVKPSKSQGIKELGLAHSTVIMSNCIRTQFNDIDSESQTPTNRETFLTDLFLQVHQLTD